MKKAKRIMALLLGIVLMFTLIPANVYAEEVDGEYANVAEEEKTSDTAEVFPENETSAQGAAQIQPMAESSGEIPQPSEEGKTRYTVLLLDQSTSMRGTPMNNLKIAAKRFCEQTFQAKDTNYVAIISYGSSVYERCSFTASYDEAAAAIDSITLQGSTDITEAILKADTLFQQVPEGDNTIKNMVLLSDGLPETGERTEDGPYTSSDYRYYQYANAAYHAAQTCKEKYHIYTLGFFHSLTGSNLEFGQRFMKDLQNAGYYEVTDPEDLEFVFGEVADDVTSEEIKIQVHYVDASADFPNIPATYSDEYFAQSSYSYNHNLAWLSLCLELSSWTNDISAWGESVEETNEIARKRYANIENAYSQMKFDTVEYYNYGDSLNSTEDKTAYSVAKKKGVDGATLVSVMVRGGGYGAEWSSNFNAGDGSRNHIGFAAAADEIYKNVTSQVSAIDGNVKIWISGYSRGAAVANLLAARLDDYAGEAGNLDAEDIFAYTFATPQGVTADHNTKADLYKNIFNIVNPGDIVPMVAPSGWKFTRYGVTRYLDMQADKDTFSTVENAYYLFTRDHDFAAKDNLNQSAAGSAMMDLVLQAFPTAKSALKIQAVIREFMEFTNTKVKTDQGWESIEADDFMVVLAKRYGDSFFEAMQYSTSFLEVTGDGKLLMSFIKDQSAKDLVYLFFTLCELHGIESGEVVDLVLGLVKSENIENALMTYLFMPDGLGGIATAHTAAVYLSWMAMSEESVFGNTMGTPKGTTIVSIACPVDIVVYDENGEQVAVVTGHELEQADIPVITDEETTKLYLPAGEQYKIEITATDSGTMNYSVTETNLEQEVTNYIPYSNIELRKGMVFTTQFDTGNEYADGKYDLTCSENGTDTIITADDTTGPDSGDTDQPGEEQMGNNSSVDDNSGGTKNQVSDSRNHVKKAAKTGDPSDLFLCLAVMLVAAGSVILIRRRKSAGASDRI